MQARLVSTLALAALSGLAVSAPPVTGLAHARPNAGPRSRQPSPAPPRKAAPSSKPGAARESLDRLRVAIQKRTLDNGLRVVLDPDHSSPTVAIAVLYDVGARDETPGRTGFAHLFEHMMFQGSRHVTKGQHFELVTARGGTLDGTTSADRTAYFESLPASELALGLWLEADRMRWLDVNQTNFDNQRKVVEEEYRMRVGNAPYAMGRLRVGELAFQGYFPYQHPAIGTMADLEHAKLAWVKAFHDAYYAPDNAVVVIAGDFDTDAALDLVHRYFDGARRRTRPPRYAPPPEPRQTSERMVAMKDANVTTPGLFNGWVIPPSDTNEHRALELATMILADGESSVLYRTLVHDRAIAQEVGAWTEDHRGPDLLTLQVVLTAKAKVAAAQKALDTEIHELARRGPAAADLDKAKTRLASAFIFGLEPNLTRAVKLGEAELFRGDARLLTRDLERYDALTSEDVKRAVAKYLVESRRTVVEVDPQ